MHDRKVLFTDPAEDPAGRTRPCHRATSTSLHASMTTTTPDTNAAAVSPATMSGSTPSFLTHGLLATPCSSPRRSDDVSTHRRRLGCRHDASQARWHTRGARKTHRHGATTANRSCHHPRTSGAGTPALACALRCALGCAFAPRHCWEYVCPVFLHSIAQNNAPQHGRNLAAARCKRFGSPGHTETPSGKHAMPARISEMRQYFRRG